jgi:response regulator RpfG family c-di-GMP phosphodiesterase
MAHDFDVSILFVDDEPDILKAIRRFLRRSPYEIEAAESAVEALEVMGSKSIAILVSDMKMPGMSGLELLQQVKREYPDTVRMALSAVTAPEQLLPCINSGEIFRYLTKPIDSSELQDALQSAVDFYLMHKDRAALAAGLRDKNRRYHQALMRLVDAGKRRKELLEELQAAMERIKQLRGLLPICASCKKIRDEKGLWHEIELYVRDHSEADFSHGICPACMKKYYPDYYERTQARRMKDDL